MMLPKQIRIDGIIGNEPGEVSSQSVRAQLPPNGTDPIAVKIHSEGGSVFEGFAIYDLFKNYAGPKSITIESCAFSIGSFITTAFDDVAITPNGYLMMHDPSISVDGNADELSKTAANLTQFKTNMVEAYMAKTGKPVEEILAILSNETFLDARQSVANGFANRIVENPVVGRVFAHLETMPHGVVSALFGAGSGGENREQTKVKPVSETQVPVAATIQQIKSAYPKAKADFVVKCLEQSMPMPQVAAAAMEEVQAENTDLNARLDAVIAELTALKEANQAEEIAEPVVQAVAKAETVEAKTTAKRSGAAPVAQGSKVKPSSKMQWSEAVALHVTQGSKRDRAILQVDIDQPGLRQAMLQEVNG